MTGKMTGGGAALIDCASAITLVESSVIALLAPQSSRNRKCIDNRVMRHCATRCAPERNADSMRAGPRRQTIDVASYGCCTSTLYGIKFMTQYQYLEQYTQPRDAGTAGSCYSIIRALEQLTAEARAARPRRRYTPAPYEVRTIHACARARACARPSWLALCIAAGLSAQPRGRLPSLTFNLCCGY